MASKHLGHDEFLTGLATLLTTTHTATHGSVFLSQKPLSSSESETPPILIRATNGLSKPHRLAHPKTTDPKSKIKLSTVVEAGDLAGFYAQYAEVCKKGMEGLRKRDKKKAKAKAKKKKAGGGTAGGS